TFTGRVITAAAAIMICVFASFLLGGERTIKEFGLGLAGAVFLDAVVVRCLMLPAVLELLGEWTWRIPHWLERALPRIRIEGSAAAARCPDRRATRPLGQAVLSSEDAVSVRSRRSMATWSGQPAPAAPSADWVRRLRADGPERDDALAELRALLVRAARFELI